MTDEQCNKFLTLLMGGEWKDYSKQWNSNHDHLANPLPVIRWMEKEMPKVWESYLYNSFRGELYTDIINSILDLRNLVAYLVEHPEWGEKECPDKGKWYEDVPVTKCELELTVLKAR